MDKIWELKAMAQRAFEDYAMDTVNPPLQMLKYAYDRLTDYAEHLESLLAWHDYPQEKPAKYGRYDVVYEQEGSGAISTKSTCIWNGKEWEYDKLHSMMRVIKYRKRPDTYGGEE